MRKFNLIKTITSSDVALCLGLILFGIASRTVLHIAPNFEFVTAITLLASLKLSKPLNVIVPAVVIIISDMIIGNTSIFLFTWSGFAGAWVIGTLLRSRFNKFQSNNQYAAISIIAIVSVLWFFLWTNFGVVIQGHMYPHTPGGYIQSLIMALPFLKIQLVSAIITSPVMLSIYNLARSAQHNTLPSELQHHKH